MMTVEHINAPASVDGSEGLLAIVVRENYHAPGVSFFTKPEDVQQVAFISYKKGHVIPAHVHHPHERVVSGTPEVLLIKRGTVKATIYTSSGMVVTSIPLTAGDLIILVGGGHGFEVTEDVEIIEVKQGPYLGMMDKVRF